MKGIRNICFNLLHSSFSFSLSLSLYLQFYQLFTVVPFWAIQTIFQLLFLTYCIITTNSGCISNGSLHNTGATHIHIAGQCHQGNNWGYCEYRQTYARYQILYHSTLSYLIETTPCRQWDQSSSNWATGKWHMDHCALEWAGSWWYYQSDYRWFLSRWFGTAIIEVSLKRNPRQDQKYINRL